MSINPGLPILIFSFYLLSSITLLLFPKLFHFFKERTPILFWLIFTILFVVYQPVILFGLLWGTDVAYYENVQWPKLRGWVPSILGILYSESPYWQLGLAYLLVFTFSLLIQKFQRSTKGSWVLALYISGSLSPIIYFALINYLIRLAIPQ